MTYYCLLQLQMHINTTFVGGALCVFNLMDMMNKTLYNNIHFKTYLLHMPK